MSGSSKPTLLKAGDVLNGRWEILAHLATGGKGEVYRARQPKLEREVVIKVISPEMLAAYEGDEEEIAAEMERFRREVLAMAATRHGNVLQVYDFEQTVLRRGEQEKILDYIVMEYIPGQTLSETIPEPGLAGQEAALKRWITTYFLPVLDGVEHIHAQGIVHRDLKPSNILLDGEVPKIADFGLVGGGPWKPVTRSHHVIGTLAYMAPEQYLDLAATTFRADLYSLGKILYKAVVGVFDRDTMKPLQTASLPRSDTQFLKALDRLIRTATAEKPEERFASVQELRNAVLALPGLIPADRAGRRKLALSLGVSLGLALALAWGLWYHFSMPELQRQPPAAQPGVAPPETTAPTGPGAPLPAKLTARGGAVLRLIPAGEIRLGGRQRTVSPFYLEETKVTNHQYVEFLNAVRGQLTVTEGVVKLGEKPLLSLREVRKGMTPLAYAGGRFRFTDPQYASHPVLMVSGYGALAFAGRYGLRLPTAAELLRAGWESPPAEAPRSGPTRDPMAEGMNAMHGQAPAPPSATPPQAVEEADYRSVAHWPPNALGIQGLATGLGEWVAGSPGQGGLAVLGRTTPEAVTLVHQHQGWELFSWVGFRCARDAVPK
ncbi:MAG: protein kinase [Deltaproteobacteria bacterium]|nr:protein kinase [Deltaproteobacteria bacterium]